MRGAESPEVAVATIEGIILRNSITFETLVTTSNFSVAWSLRSPVVVDYIISHIEEVFNCGIYVTSTPASPVSGICLQILQCRDSNFYFELFKSQKFFEYIVQFPFNMHKYNVRTQVTFFDCLTIFIAQSGFQMLTHINMISFFTSLANRLILDTPARFIQAMVITLSPTSYPIFKQSNLCAILANEYISDSPNGVTALRLMQNCFINEFFLAHVSETFSNQMLLQQMRQHSFLKRDTHGVDFIRGLYLAAQPLKDTQERWLRISSDIEKDLSYAADTIYAATSFGMFENSVGKLFIVLTNGTKVIDEKSLRIFSKSLDMLFQNPLNSFIHNFAVACIQALVENKGDVENFLERTSLPKRLIQQYLKRGTTTAVYWGQLRVISETIEPYIDETKYTNWDSVISQENNKIRNILDVPIIESHGLVRSTQGSTLFISLHRLPKKKRIIVIIGLVSFILFIYVYLFV